MPTQNTMDWTGTLQAGAAFVAGTDVGVTLRQLFYHLVARGLLPNTLAAYKALSDRTTRAREAGRFPNLIDRVRDIVRYSTWADVSDARTWLQEVYRRDRTVGQSVSLYLAVEKAGLVEQVQAWFGDLGVPILPLGGYSSHTFKARVAGDVAAQGPLAVLLYAGDFDPSGEDIDRDFVEKTACWAHVERVALTAAQVEAYGLPPAMGKAGDSRAAKFVARHGRLVQVELDALPPEVLRRLVAEAMTAWWDDAAYHAMLAHEAPDRAVLAACVQAAKRRRR
jgi:hypothetical protein